jgi:hypothetical protein
MPQKKKTAQITASMSRTLITLTKGAGLTDNIGCLSILPIRRSSELSQLT